MCPLNLRLLPSWQLSVSHRIMHCLNFAVLFCCRYLLVLDRTNWKTNMLTGLLVPYIFFTLPGVLFSLVRWLQSQFPFCGISSCFQFKCSCQQLWRIVAFLQINRFEISEILNLENRNISCIFSRMKNQCIRLSIKRGKILFIVG